MADKYIYIQNFKFGVDARRSELASQPGTLVKCENAHINHGGEIEKRKGFFKNQYTYPTNTFGLEVTASGMVTFGSDAAPNATLPNGVTYQRLQHPNGAAMTAVVYSCNFQGSAFVIATFSDGVSLCFYGGTLVNDSWNGKVLTGLNSLANQATELAAQFNALTGWNATAGVDPSGNPETGSVIVKSPPGITFAPVEQVNSAAGLLGTVNLNDTSDLLAGIPATAAVAAFLVVAGTTGTYSLAAPYPLSQGGSGTGATLATNVARQSSIGATGNAIVAAINATTILYGYRAYTDGAGNVFVAAPVSWGAAANTFTLTITLTGDVNFTTATVNSPLSITISPNPATDTGYAPNGGFFSFNENLIISGGYPPYLVAWAEQFTGSSNGIAFAPYKVTTATTYFQVGDGNTCTFSKSLLGPVTIESGQFKVTVTDSKPGGPPYNTQTLNFAVTLRNL